MNVIAMSLSGWSILLDAPGGPLLGRAAFVGVFVVLLIWLIVMPGRLIGEGDVRPPWWRSARVWGIVVTVAQILVYLRWG